MAEESRSNPYGMDADCQACPALVESRECIVHGYGDVAADLLVVGRAPAAGSQATGIPGTGEGERVLLDILADVGRCPDPEAGTPTLDRTFWTYLTRCHHPERGPTDAEVDNCEPFLSSEIRTLNPELIVGLGERVLDALAFEYTRRSAGEFDLPAEHATTIRGRGFEILPSVDPATMTADQREAFGEHLAAELGRDYRQTKGQRRK
jgi:uracil-DNA glycosylase family 4